MVRFGYALSSEEHRSADLVRNAALAEDAGFEFALISDHYHPWVDAQGHSPFVWTILGGIARETRTLEVGTGVTCPMIRIHPAIIAQAAATTADSSRADSSWGSAPARTPCRPDIHRATGRRQVGSSGRTTERGTVRPSLKSARLRAYQSPGAYLTHFRGQDVR